MRPQRAILFEDARVARRAQARRLAAPVDSVRGSGDLTVLLVSDPDAVAWFRNPATPRCRITAR